MLRGDLMRPRETLHDSFLHEAGHSTESSAAHTAQVEPQLAQQLMIRDSLPQRTPGDC